MANFETFDTKKNIILCNMEEVRQILSMYITIKMKTIYLKSYLEQIDELYKNSSEILNKAVQIPRDKSWNDNNLSSIVEINERQCNIYEETSKDLNLICKELENLLIQVNDEIKMIENDLAEVILQNEARYNELEKCKKLHIESWIREKDPWLTDIKLKIAIKNMYSLKENNSMRITTKISIYSDKLQFAQDTYYQILQNYIKTQKGLFNNMLDFLNIKISPYEINEKYYDTSSANTKEIIESKIINSYEMIINSISNELLKKDICIYKNIEPIKYGLCKVKTGFTSDWMLLFISVTKSKFVHLFELNNLDSKILHKYKNLFCKIKSNANRSIVSIFDSKKNDLNYNDEKNMVLLNDEIRINIDKLIDNIKSINLKEKIIKLDKENCIISISDKSQIGLSKIVGINVIKIKCFTLTNCYEFFFSMKKEEINLEIKAHIENKNIKPKEETGKKKVIRIEELNPWSQDL